VWLHAALTVWKQTVWGRTVELLINSELRLQLHGTTESPDLLQPSGPHRCVAVIAFSLQYNLQYEIEFGIISDSCAFVETLSFIHVMHFSTDAGASLLSDIRCCNLNICF
ncbi:Hypothetical predicted protein, partial [Scomber scombrus]